MNAQACMMPGSVLRRGLKSMGDAWAREITESIVKLWAQLMRDISDEQFEYGVTAVLRTARSFFPTPGQVLEAAYTMPLPRKAPPIREGDFWDSPQQAAFVERTVHENPRMKHEGAMQYARRIAILSGLMSPDDREIALESTHLTRAQDVRLPYREPGEDAE